MNVIKGIKKALLCVIISVLFFETISFASDNAAIVERITNEDSISIYIKGISEEINEASVQIGTTVAEVKEIQKIRDLDIPMQTLILVDNSLSISKDNREKNASFIHDFISDRLNNEQIAIATFSDKVTFLTEYTNDYAALKKAAEGIVYEDLETYLTDVLYELLSESFIENNEDIYRRIIVISDGVDNKSLGYTKEELYSLLKDNSIPIYTIGCGKGKNDENMENMFALSRMTSAEYFIMDDVEDTLDITGVLKNDYDIVKMTMLPTKESMDGSKKAVKVTVSDSAKQISLTTEMLMPHKYFEAETEEETETVPVPQESTVVETEVESETVEEETEDGFPIVLIIIGAVVVLLIVAGIIIFRYMKKRNRVEFEPIGANEILEMEQNNIESDTRTEMINAYSVNTNDDERTCMIWENNTTYQVVLIDIESPMRTFQVPIQNSITIGRKQEYCDIALDFEKSVSSKQCQISVRDGRFYICDLQSANGTYVNGSKVLTETEIASGNIIKLGRLQMRFEIR